MKERRVNRITQLRSKAKTSWRQQFGVPKGSKWMAKLMRQERLQARNRRGD
jgi:hypothetical protein